MAGLLAVSRWHMDEPDRTGLLMQVICLRLVARGTSTFLAKPLHHLWI